MDIMVPLPSATPMEATTSEDDSSPMRAPADASMVPEVMMVGNAWLRVSTIASFSGISCLRLVYLLVITIA